MVPRICTLPTSRRPKVSTDTIRSSQRSSAMSAPSRVSLTSTFLHTCIFISSFLSGGAIAGSISQHIGRRLTIILFVMLSGVFIPLLDYSVWFQYACSWRVLCAIWRTGCLGCHPHPARRNESTRVPCYLPRCRIPNWKRTWFYYTMWLMN